MIFIYKERPSYAYAAAVCALGIAAVAVSLVGPALPLWEARYLLIAFCALTAGTLLCFKVPNASAIVPLSSVFVPVAAILYGPDAAVPIAASAALVTSLRLSRGARVSLCDSALAAATAFCSMRALLWPEGVALIGPLFSTVVAVAACSLIQAAAESLPVAVHGPGAGGKFSLRLYLRSFKWGAAAYLIPTSAALLVARLLHAPALEASLAVAALCSAAYALYRIRKSSGEVAEQERVVEAVSNEVAAISGARSLYAVFNHAAIGMAILSTKGKLLRVNRSMCHFFGYSESELMYSSLEAITEQEDLGPALAGLKSVVKRQSDFLQIEVRHKRCGGERVWALWNVARFQDPESDEVYLILQLQDITERKQSEERLRYDAFHDPLTGLPNRALFIDHVKLTIARAQRHQGTRFAVLFCDLDRFKVVNDSLGHMVGDQLLVEVARRLENCLRQGDTVARVGGDEFTILVEDLMEEREGVALAERIQSTVSAPFNLGGREVFTTLSIGVAVATGGYKDPEDILRDADTAMYRAKSLGKARHVVFDQSMHASAVNLLQIETDLRTALEKKQFFILYQPIVSLDNFKLCGFEALLRWHHPERGLISPLDFIPIAEETGQIIAIGEWALYEACRQMKRWEKEYGSASPLFISVNLSCKQFNNQMLLEQVGNVLNKTGISPRRLKLEITESAVMENIDSATEMLGQLRDLGVQLAIDDFGTGYSSLSYLHRFPIDTLKIDRSFVTRMADNAENVEIVRTIVMLAQVLGMDVVAEGVETKEQLKILRDLKCEYGQGYYFSRPTNTSDAEKIIIETDDKLQKVFKPETSQPLASNAPVKMLNFFNNDERPLEVRATDYTQPSSPDAEVKTTKPIVLDDELQQAHEAVPAQPAFSDADAESLAKSLTDSLAGAEPFAGVDSPEDVKALSPFFDDVEFMDFFDDEDDPQPVASNADVKTLALFDAE